MILLLGMPSSAEWGIVSVLFLLFLLFPVAAVYYFAKSRRLMKELDSVSQERNELLKKFLEQK